MANVKFIRKNGRIIPIGYSPNYKTSAAIGVTVGALGTAGKLAGTLGREVRNVKAVKFGAKSAKVVGALSALGVGLAVYKGVEAQKKQRTGVTEAAKHLGSQWLGAAVGASAFGAYAGVKVALGIARRNQFLKVVK